MIDHRMRHLCDSFGCDIQTHVHTTYERIRGKCVYMNLSLGSFRLQFRSAQWHGDDENFYKIKLLVSS